MVDLVLHMALALFQSSIKNPKSLTKELSILKLIQQYLNELITSIEATH